MNVKQIGRVEVLKLIREKKDVLMGAFSERITKNDKINAWKEVHEKAAALGLVPETKDYTYTRDTFRQNIRKNTMKKIDNAKKTGSKGGPDCKLTDIDNVVCDIIGRDSPVMAGLPTKESWDSPSLLSSEGSHSSSLEQVKNTASPENGHWVPIMDDDAWNEPGHDFKSQSKSTVMPISKRVTMPVANPQSKNASKPNSNSVTYSLKRKQPIAEGIDEEEVLRIKKLQLSIDIMEREKHIKTLEILKLERELMITDPSPFTSNFPRLECEIHTDEEEDYLTAA